MRVMDLAWAAGVIEGEGWFSGGIGPYPSVAVNMTDRDVIERLRGVFGCGSITERKRADPKHKTGHVWRVYGDNAAGVMMTLFAFMGVRRRARIKQLLTAWRSSARRQRHRGAGITECPHIEREHIARGMCDSCYRRSRRKHREPSLYRYKKPLSRAEV